MDGVRVYRGYMKVGGVDGCGQMEMAGVGGMTSRLCCIFRFCYHEGSLSQICFIVVHISKFRLLVPPDSVPEHLCRILHPFYFWPPYPFVPVVPCF